MVLSRQIGWSLAAETMQGADPHRVGAQGSLELETADGRSVLVTAVADGVGFISGTLLPRTSVADFAVQALIAHVQDARPASSEMAAVLLEGLRGANRSLYEHALANHASQGMVTSCLALAVVGERLVLAHVGNCRAYLVRRGRAQQLTTDHTWAEEMVAAGRLTAETAQQHPNRDVMRRLLGVTPQVQPDATYRLDLPPGRKPTDSAERPLYLHLGDRVVLCTKGVSDALTPAQLSRLVARGHLPQMARALIRKAHGKAAAAPELGAAVAIIALPGPPRTRFSALVRGGSMAAGLLLTGGALAWALWVRPTSTPVSTPPPRPANPILTPATRTEAIIPRSTGGASAGATADPNARGRPELAGATAEPTVTLLPTVGLAPAATASSRVGERSTPSALAAPIVSLAPDPATPPLYPATSTSAFSGHPAAPSPTTGATLIGPTVQPTTVPPTAVVPTEAPATEVPPTEPPPTAPPPTAAPPTNPPPTTRIPTQPPGPVIPPRTVSPMS